MIRNLPGNMKNMIIRNICLILIYINLASCTGMPDMENTAGKENEILYVFPDGRYEFNGRTLNSDDVVIYRDGRGGERAAVKLVIPRHPDVFRDSITVERIDVPVEHKRE